MSRGSRALHNFHRVTFLLARIRVCILIKSARYSEDIRCITLWVMHSSLYLQRYLNLSQTSDRIMVDIDTIEDNFSLYRVRIARRCIFSSLSIIFKRRLIRSEQQYISLLTTIECILLLVIEKVNLLRDFIML